MKKFFTSHNFKDTGCDCDFVMFKSSLLFRMLTW